MDDARATEVNHLALVLFLFVPKISFQVPLQRNRQEVLGHRVFSPTDGNADTACSGFLSLILQVSTASVV
jgi:hypothetical protein